MVRHRFALAGIAAVALISSCQPTYLAAAHADQAADNSQTKMTTAKTLNGYQPMWWKEAVVYQVYPLHVLAFRR